MAKVLQNGEYDKIDKRQFLIKKVEVLKFKNEAHRKATAEEDFDKIAKSNIMVEVDLSIMADPNKSILDNILTASYLALDNAVVIDPIKTTPYSEATDC